MLQLQYQELRPLTTAHLAQTMTLLNMTIEEIKQQVESELASNPALELIEERHCPSCQRPLLRNRSCPVCTLPNHEFPDEPVVFISHKDDFYSGNSYSEDNSNEERDISPSVEDLPTYVLRQVAPELSIEDRKLAAFILANLNDDGFLTVEPVEIAMYHHVPLSRINELKKLIQGADPIGVCARSPQEALLVQLEILSESYSVPRLALEIIRDDVDLLIRKQFVELAHKYDVTLKEIQQIARFIGDNLNPFPARSHWGDVRDPVDPGVQVFHRPDVIIDYLNGDPANPFVVEIIMPFGGSLRVNPLFKDVFKDATKNQKSEWKTDMDRASLFVKCLQQRNQTMKRLMHTLVSLQRKFINDGPKHLIPITRVEISKQLEVHESTISRAVSKKTVQLPNKKIIPMSSFFDRSLNVRTVLREIIEHEDRPYSDSKLADMLAERGYRVARRTVAKYRSMEGILPAHIRRMVSQPV
ncbi:MAG: hypothetical protein MUO76_04540 [Anaerolineaceae bacterium]|nr:hypothetical protein [Anaerolineaceae bacterium]